MDRQADRQMVAHESPPCISTGGFKKDPGKKDSLSIQNLCIQCNLMLYLTSAINLILGVGQPTKYHAC